MGAMMWIGIAVVIVIIYFVFFSAPGYDTYPNTSYVGAKVPAKSSKNFIILADGAADQTACQTACSGTSWCKGYTFISEGGAPTCVGVKNPNKGNKVTGGNYVSGLRRTGGFAPKIGQMFGSESAGKSESFLPIAPRSVRPEPFDPTAPRTAEFFDPTAPRTAEFFDPTAPRVNEFFDPTAPRTAEFFDPTAPRTAEFMTTNPFYGSVDAQYRSS